jgi:hypothetical protein
MTDDAYFAELSLHNAYTALRLELSPQRVPEVRPLVLATMKALLTGTEVPQDPKGLVDEFALQREKQKLKQVFPNPQALQKAFTCVENYRNAQRLLQEMNINTTLLKEYAYLYSNSHTVDAFDLYQHLLFNAPLHSKEARLKANRLCVEEHPYFQAVFNAYALKHYSPIHLEKDFIEENETLKQLFQERHLLNTLNQLWQTWYATKPHAEIRHAVFS